MEEVNKKMIPDIYFDDNFGKLYEKIEHGSSQVYTFKNEFGTVKTQFIKRRISTIINGETYYDIITPYGYGGPIIVECAGGKKEELVSAFHDAFLQYCAGNRIVSEFIRFHPIVKNAHDFRSIYQVENIRKTVGTNIKDHDDPVQSEFSKSCRKSIRQALKKGVTYNIIEKPKNIHNFKQIYYSTMDRNEATEYYYFGDEYFDKCLKYYREHIILVEAVYKSTVIASGFYFVYGKILGAHLSGTQNEYIYLAPAYIIKFATAQWAKEHGIEIIHYGGGATNSPDDSLYKFKRKFTKEMVFDFYIGKKIWNQDIYDELVEKHNCNKSNDNSSYFPLYRA